MQREKITRALGGEMVRLVFTVNRAEGRVFVRGKGINNINLSQLFTFMSFWLNLCNIMSDFEQDIIESYLPSLVSRLYCCFVLPHSFILLTYSTNQIYVQQFRGLEASQE